MPLCVLEPRSSHCFNYFSGFENFKLVIIICHFKIKEVTILAAFDRKESQNEELELKHLTDLKNHMVDDCRTV